MEFTLKSIQEAHEKYTGPDFPNYLKHLKTWEWSVMK